MFKRTFFSALFLLAVFTAVEERALAQWTVECTSSTFYQAESFGNIYLSWSLPTLYYVQDATSVKVLPSPCATTPLYTYVLTSQERTAQYLYFGSLYADLTQDDIFETFLLAYCSDRTALKIFDITNSAVLLSLDEANIEYGWADITDYDQDGMLECIIPAFNMSSQAVNIVVYNTGIPGNVVEPPAGQRDFRLQQNFPNPFNPVTRIEYSLSAPGQVELEIFNALGQKVTSLVNSRQEAGSHFAIWNSVAFGRATAAGPYFYQLNVDGKWSGARKMILLK
jgi:hypothetical protein